MIFKNQKDKQTIHTSTNYCFVSETLLFCDGKFTNHYLATITI